MAVCLEGSGSLTLSFVNHYPRVELFWNVSKANFQSPSKICNSLERQLFEHRRGNEDVRGKTAVPDFFSSDKTNSTF